MVLLNLSRYQDGYYDYYTIFGRPTAALKHSRPNCHNLGRPVRIHNISYCVWPEGRLLNYISSHEPTKNYAHNQIYLVGPQLFELFFPLSLEFLLELKVLLVKFFNSFRLLYSLFITSVKSFFITHTHTFSHFHTFIIIKRIRRVCGPATHTKTCHSGTSVSLACQKPIILLRLAFSGLKLFS